MSNHSDAARLDAFLADTGRVRSFSTAEVAAIFGKTANWVHWVLHTVTRVDGTPIAPERVSKTGTKGRFQFTRDDIEQIAKGLFLYGTLTRDGVGEVLACLDEIDQSTRTPRLHVVPADAAVGFIGTEGGRVEDLAVRVTCIEVVPDLRAETTHRITLETVDGRKISWYRKRPIPFAEGDPVVIVDGFIKRHLSTRDGDRTVLTHVTVDLLDDAKAS